MKVTYLGQAGLLFEHEGFRIMLDPYLSDSVAKIEPQNRRRVPVDERFFAIRPDVMIFTHNHADHYDPEDMTCPDGWEISDHIMQEFISAYKTMETIFIKLNL